MAPGAVGKSRTGAISKDADIGRGVTLGRHVTIYPGVRVGDGCRVFDGAVLGRPPQAAGTITRTIATTGQLTLGAGSVVGANAVLYTGSSFGANVLVGDLATVREGCAVGDGAVIGRGVMVMYDTTIGARTRVIDGAILTGNMTIEEDVFIGPGVLSINDDNVYLTRFGLAPFATRGPTIRRLALIGAGANLASGIEVGEGAIVAPSSMVTRDVPSWRVVAGIPARAVRAVAEADRQAILARFPDPSMRKAA